MVTSQNLRKMTDGTNRSGACGLVRLITGKMSSSINIKDWQIERSFGIIWVAVHGHSKLV